MDQEIIKPENTPPESQQQLGRSGLIVAAIGATLLALTHLGAAAAATIWALSQLIGLPDTAMWVAMALGAIPVLWATVWTAGRAWHVERRIEGGLDVDTPVFSLMHYWKKA
jgi:hypothetical protein